MPSRRPIQLGNRWLPNCRATRKGRFKRGYAGKLNFYCNVGNDQLKHATDEPTIGLILCQTRDHLLAEYSFAGIDKPMKGRAVLSLCARPRHATLGGSYSAPSRSPLTFEEAPLQSSKFLGH